MEDNPVGEHPFGNLEQAEPETTYEGRKQAALRRIAALAGDQVPVKKVGWKRLFGLLSQIRIRILNAQIM